MLNPTCKKCDAEMASIYYHKHKNDPAFKQKNCIRAKQYAEKNIDQIKTRKATPEFKTKHAEHNLKSYHKVKDLISAKMKHKRQTPEYKAMMRDYRNRNKDKIFKQEKVTKLRYHEKNRDDITDAYVINLLRGQGIINPTAEQIEIKRAEILLLRIKKIVHQKPVGQTKKCTKCLNEKDKSEFYPVGPGKISAMCKKCNNEICRQYRLKRRASNDISRGG